MNRQLLFWPPIREVQTSWLLPIRAERNPSSAKSPAIKAMANFTRQQIRTQVGRILWGQWDPLGVHEDPKAWGSYDAYVSGILRSLVRGASDEELTEYPYDLETQHMGLSGSSDAHTLRTLSPRCEP